MTSPETETPVAEGVARIGMVISGRYVIKQLLGEGGMGSVYLAEHTGMKKRVALKLLHPEMSDNPEVSARFEREAMAAAHVEHPNVAGATDFGKTEDGAFFLVLEYVEGTSLRDALDDGPLSPTRALRITRQIALALERAHDAGIVHRDLKPENVMLVKRELEPDFVKVLDFGIAKVLEGAASASAAIARRQAGSGKPNEPLTRLGTILGTPEYMAPEQALGEAVTPAADLYGVGVMLYEMLTGKHPFDPPDRTAMLSFHIVAPVPPMEDRAPNVEVPPKVEALTRCLLEKDAKKRYANARALIDAIDEAAAASGIDAGGTPSRISVPSPEDAPRSARWVDKDSFAKTSYGASPPPDANTTTAVADGSAQGAPAAVAVKLNDGSSPADEPRAPGVLGALGRQPRVVLYLLSAGLPLLLVLAVAIGYLALRSKPGAKGPKKPGTSESAEVAKPKNAPADRVQAAIALGPDALEALTKEFPEDTSLLQKLAIAYQAQGKSAEAIRTTRSLLAADPTAAKDDEIVQLVATVAAKGQGDADDEAFALLEGPLGERGVDALIDLGAKGPGREAQALRTRTAKSLAKPEVRAHATPAAGVLLDLKAAPTCVAKHELLPRVKENGDARLAGTLKSFKATRGCGFIGRMDCWGCMRRDTALDEAIAAVDARASAAPPK